MRVAANPPDPRSDTQPPRLLLALRFAGARVLLAEDDPTSRKLARYLLEDAGLALDLVDNGAQALAQAGRRPGGYATT